MICPSCAAPVERHQWTPYNVSGKLHVACVCRCGTRWSYDKVEMIIPPRGKAPDTIPLAWAPVDTSEI